MTDEVCDYFKSILAEREALLESGVEGHSESGIKGHYESDLKGPISVGS